MPYSLIYGEKSITTITNATYQDGLDFLELAFQIRIKTTVNPIPFDELNNALIDLKNSVFNGEAVLKVI